MKAIDVRRATGLTEKAMRLYEDKGLISPSTREQNGKRFREYSEEDVALLTTIAALRRARFSVEQIGRILREPSSVTAVFAEYKADLQKEAGEIEELLAAVNAVEVDTLRTAGDLAVALSPVAEPMPLPARDRDYRPYRWEEISEEERQVAFERFWKKQEKRLDRERILLKIASLCGWGLTRIVLPAALVWACLYYIPVKESVSEMIPAVEYDVNTGEMVDSTVIRLEGEIWYYLLQPDVYKGTIAIDGYKAYSWTMESFHGFDSAAYSDLYEGEYRTKILFGEYPPNGSFMLYPLEGKYMYRLYRMPLWRSQSLFGSAFIQSGWSLDEDDYFARLVLDLSGENGSKHILAAPAANAEDARALWMELTEKWEREYEERMKK